MTRLVGLVQFVSCTSLLLIISTLIRTSHQRQPNLKENDPCITTDGLQGVCKTLDNCSEGLASIQSGGRPKTCGFTADTLILCCPADKSKGNVLPPKMTPSDQPSTDQLKSNEYLSAAKKAKQKCEEFAKTVILEFESPILVEGASGTERIDTCARVEEPLVVGGENAKGREFPHMALIGYGDVDVIWLCGGSLISERFILSAAHCSRTASLGEAKWAKLGELDTSTEMDDALPQEIKIVERIVYSKYNRDLLYNDIALFKLEKNVEISEYIRPLCLFSETKIPQNKVIATGWGHTSWDNNTSLLSSKSNVTEEEDLKQDEMTLDDIAIANQSQIDDKSGTASASLMKVKLEMVSTETCDERYKPSRGKKLAQGILEETQLCAGDEVGKDTCQGDSGGPLQIPLKEPYCMYALIGVTSFGKSCGTGYPGVYTRVSHYLPWIVENVWP